MYIYPYIYDLFCLLRRPGSLPFAILDGFYHMDLLEFPSNVFPYTNHKLV